MNFFITGNSSIKGALDLNLIAPVNAGAGNFADKGQTLVQSYSIAQNIFRLVGKDKINFVLIGLNVDALIRDSKESLAAGIFDKNLQALNDYIKLCLANGAKPVAVIFPVAPNARERYRKIFWKSFADILNDFEGLYHLQTINFFDLELPANYFSDETHLTKDGAIRLSVILAMELLNLKIFSIEDFSRLNYLYFYYLSYVTDKKFFHNLLAQIYSRNLEEIRRKDKIKVAFVTDHAACWCGDKLYNLFAQNPRFETTVFLIKGTESTLEDASHDLEQFKSAGINVVGVFNLNEETPPQDIIFFLRPYPPNFSASFQFNVMTPQTLIAYIPYSLETAPSFLKAYYGLPIFCLAWKYFFEAESSLKLYAENCHTGAPRGVVSGQPKLDFFFEDTSKISFAWKMAQPDAKKIIWAPHHSFDKTEIAGIKSTFPHNFKFMYEFAKAHPEFSWVVKPHPRLSVAAVRTKLFPSLKDYEEYLRKWDELPNAQVYTGGYYQDIFATSDGMIHDSISFIAEYQYVNKPMIYLLNNEQEEFTELGKKILDASYVIDGKNFEQIADALQKIFIEGNDPLQTARQKVFDAELNYYRKNGMTASEFIYKTIAQELELS